MTGFRGRGVDPRPPDPGANGRRVLAAMKTNPGRHWPTAVIAEAFGAQPWVWAALSRLVALRLVEIVGPHEVRVTARGLRYRS